MREHVTESHPRGQEKLDCSTKIISRSKLRRHDRAEFSDEGNGPVPAPADDAEKAIIGCLISDPRLIPRVRAAGISPAMFDDHSRGIAFRLLVKMDGDGAVIDPTTVVAELRRNAQFGFDPVNFIIQMQDAAPSPAGWQYWVEPIKDAHRRRQAAKIGVELARMAADPRQDSESLLADGEAMFRGVFAGVGNDLPALADAADFIMQPLDEPKQVLRGVLNQGSKLALGGGSKSFKTWVLLDLALSVAHGKPWLNFETTAGKVLFVNFEIQDYAWQTRVRAVARAKGIEIAPGALMLLNMRGRAADHQTLLPQIREIAKGHNLALIILDPLYKLYGNTDENAAGDVAALLNALEALAVETGAAVAFGAHFSKGNQSGKESLDRISGSGVFARDPDSLLVMTRHENDGCFTVEPTLRTFAPVEPFVVEWQHPLMNVTELDPSKLKKAAGRGRKYSPDDAFNVLPAGGFGTVEWLKAAMEENGMSAGTFYTLKKQLVEQGRVIKSVSGKFLPASK